MMIFDLNRNLRRDDYDDVDKALRKLIEISRSFDVSEKKVEDFSRALESLGESFFNNVKEFVNNIERTPAIFLLFSNNLSRTVDNIKELNEFFSSRFKYVISEVAKYNEELAQKLERFSKALETAEAEAIRRLYTRQAQALETVASQFFGGMMGIGRFLGADVSDAQRIATRYVDFMSRGIQFAGDIKAMGDSAPAILQILASIITSGAFIAISAGVVSTLVGLTLTSSFVISQMSAFAQYRGYGMAGAYAVGGTEGYDPESQGIFGSVLRALGFSYRHWQAQRIAAYYGVHEEDFRAASRYIWETGASEEIRRAMAQGVSEQALAGAVRQLYTTGIAQEAIVMRAAQAALGVSQEFLWERFQTLRALTGERDIAMTVAYTRQLQREAQERGVDFEWYIRTIEETTKSLRELGFSIVSAREVISQYTEELRTGLVDLQKFTSTLREAYGGGAEQTLRQYVMMMMFGPRELRNALMQAGPIGGSVLLNILQTTGYEGLERARPYFENVPGGQAYIRAIDTLLSLGRERYETISAQARALPMQIPFALFGGMEPLSQIFLATQFGRQMGGVTVSPWGVSLERVGPTYAAVMEAAARPAAEMLERPMSKEDAERITQSVVQQGTLISQSMEKLWDKAQSFLIKFFSPRVSNDIANALAPYLTRR